MNIFDLIYKHRYSAKHYKKYCKDANTTFVYATVYLQYYDDLNDLPNFVKNVYYITTFLADTLNSSMYLFFYDETSYNHKDDIEKALKEAKMEDVLSIFRLSIETFSNIKIRRDISLSEFKESLPQNIKYNVNFYEEELAKLQQNDFLYNKLNEYFLNELSTN